MLETPPGQTPVVRKNSGFGIASFLIFQVFFIYAVLLILIATCTEIARPGAMAAGSSAYQKHGMMLFLLSCLGVASGGAGLAQRNRRKIFAVLGLALNLAFFLTFFVFMIINQ